MKDYIKSIHDAERRFFSEPVGFEKRDDGVNDNVIEGYAAVFNKDSEDFGGWRERIRSGAFSDVLQDDAFALFNHDMNLVLGRNKVNVTLSQDETGLKYRVELPDTSLAKDLRELVKKDIINQSSFAFTVAEQEWKHTDGLPSVRTITKIKQLYDVSPVTTPAYKDTTVAARSLEAERPKEDDQQLTADLMDLKINFINKHTI